MTDSQRTVICAALLGLTAVAAGAFGAHGLKNELTASGQLETWKTAAHYQLVHAAALLGLGAWQAHSEGPWLRRAALSWLYGALLFSCSLYLLSLGAPKWLGPVTPIGGLLLIIGWGFLIPACLRTKQG